MIVTHSLDGNGPAALGLTPQLRPDLTVIRLSGELDCATAEHLPRYVGKLAPENCRWVHLDLAELAFIDAAGLSALVRANDAISERLGRMTVGRLRPLARRLLDVTGLPLTILDDGLERQAAAKLQHRP